MVSSKLHDCGHYLLHRFFPSGTGTIYIWRKIIKQIIINKFINGKATNAFSIPLNPFVFLIMCFKENTIPIIKGTTIINSMINMPIVVPKNAAIEAEFSNNNRSMSRNIPLINPNIFSV